MQTVGVVAVVSAASCGLACCGVWYLQQVRSKERLNIVTDTLEDAEIYDGQTPTNLHANFSCYSDILRHLLNRPLALSNHPTVRGPGSAQTAPLVHRIRKLAGKLSKLPVIFQIKVWLGYGFDRLAGTHKHRRLRKRLVFDRYVRHVAAEVRSKMGATPERTYANQLTVRSIATKYMRENHHRATYIVRDLPKIELLVFTPTNAELDCATIFGTDVAQRAKEWASLNPSTRN